MLFQKICETNHVDGRLVPIYAKFTAGLFALASLPSLVLFIWAPQLFNWIFGPQWHTAGEFARYLVLWMVFASCNLPAVLFARLIRIQRTIFFYDMFLLFCRFLVLVLGGLYLSASNTIIVFSLLGATMNLFLILLVGYAVMKKEGSISLERIRDSLMKG